MRLECDELGSQAVYGLVRRSHIQRARETKPISCDAKSIFSLRYAQETGVNRWRTSHADGMVASIISEEGTGCGAQGVGHRVSGPGWWRSLWAVPVGAVPVVAVDFGQLRFRPKKKSSSANSPSANFSMLNCGPRKRRKKEEKKKKGETTVGDFHVLLQLVSLILTVTCWIDWSSHNMTRCEEQVQ